MRRDVFRRQKTVIDMESESINGFNLCLGNDYLKKLNACWNLIKIFYYLQVNLNIVSIKLNRHFELK